MKIRRATILDSEKVAMFAAKSFSETFSHLYPPIQLEAYLKENYDPQVYLKWIENRLNYGMWVYENHNAEVLGYILAGPCTLPHDNVSETSGEIIKCYVDKSLFGTGLAASLFEEALKWLREVYIGDIFIGVYSENFRAQKFYSKYGFEKVGEYFFEVGECRDREFILCETVFTRKLYPKCICKSIDTKTSSSEEPMNIDQGEEFISVWVGYDGGTWSCSPSIHYRIPTTVFDYHMMLGSLNTKEDLDLLMSSICNSSSSLDTESDGGTTCVEVEYTDIWVLPGGAWSGSPSIHFKLPIDVFNFLAEKDRQKCIGDLATQNDLDNLVEKTRLEMYSGFVDSSSSNLVYTRTKPLNHETKLCGHICTSSSIKEGCCACLDLRPVIEEGTYPLYLDGTGWANKAMRSAGYCPICN